MYIKYYESGLVPIPIKPKSKAPAVSGFQHWAHEGIPREKVEEFEEKFPIEKGYGIGIVCGAASNICVVDIDTDDPEVLHACPPSPVRRRGKKGEARFFQFNPDLSNKSFFAGNTREKGGAGIDIWVEKKYIIVPPSIHPETNRPFVWLTPDGLLDLESQDLPELYPEDVDKMGSLLGADDHSSLSSGVELTGLYDSPDGKRCPHGSYHRIKALAQGLIAKGSTIDEGIQALIDYDKAHHQGVRFFEEKRIHADFGADPYSNAARLYCNLLKATNEMRIKKGFEPQLPSKPKEIDISELIILEKKKKDLTQLEPYPKPRGAMEKFVAYCELMGKGKQDALALGGSLALMSGLCANRFRSEVRGLPVWPNMYFLNLGYSGFGKDASQTLIDHLLAETKLIGSANYRSGTAIVQSLPKQQERLDVIDEASWLLKAMHSGDSYQAEMVELLSLLFSRASSRFNGISSAKDGNRFGACWNPCVSMLASTTPTGFKESVNAAMASKGLMPRFLTFFQKDIGSYKGQTDVDSAKAIKSDLEVYCNAILGIDKTKHPAFQPKRNYVAEQQGKNNEDLSMGFRYLPEMVPFSKEAHDVWMDFEKDCHEKSAENPDGFESAFFARFAEISSKIALLDRISLIDATELPIRVDGLEVESDNILWAINLVQVCWKNSRALYELTTATSKHEADAIKILDVIKKAGGQMTQSQLCQKTRWLNPKQRNTLLQSLVDSGDLEMVMARDGKSGPKTKVWRIIK